MKITLLFENTLNDNIKLCYNLLKEKTNSKLLSEEIMYQGKNIKGVIDIGTNSCRLFIAELENTSKGKKIKRELVKDVDRKLEERELIKLII